MSPQAKTQGQTDTTSTAQARFTVQLPAALRPGLDAIKARIGEAVRKETGVSVELSTAQVVESLIKDAITAKDGAESSTAAATSEDGASSDGS